MMSKTFRRLRHVLVEAATAELAIVTTLGDDVLLEFLALLCVGLASEHENADLLHEIGEVLVQEHERRQRRTALLRSAVPVLTKTIFARTACFTHIELRRFRVDDGIDNSGKRLPVGARVLAAITHGECEDAAKHFRLELCGM